MKEGWTYKKLGEVFRTYAGGTPSKSNKANYENGTIPWIRSGEVCQKYITESELCISEEGLRNSSAKFYPANTVLVAMYGATAAQCGILKFEATSNQAVCGILPHEDFSPEFVYAYFTYIKEDLAAQAQGGAQPNISQEKIKKVLFPCIPLSEQLSIVARLDAAFANIDALKANAEKQLAEARKLFQAELTECMRPKEGWEEKRFHQVIKLQSGDNLPAKCFVEGQYPVYGGNGIAGYHNSYNKEGEHVIVGRVGALCGNVHYINSPFWLTDNGFEVIIDSHFMMDKRFLSQYLTYLKLGNYARQAAQPVISNVSLKDIVISIPPFAEQHQIVTRLDALSAHVRQLEEVQRKTLAECDALKQAMLKEVFE